MMAVETYRHSGGVGALGIPLMCLAGGITAAALGVAYAYGLAWIPLIYVSFFADGRVWSHYWIGRRGLCKGWQSAQPARGWHYWSPLRDSGALCRMGL